MQYIIHCFIEVSLCWTLSKLTNTCLVQQKFKQWFILQVTFTWIYWATIVVRKCQTVNLMYQNSMKLIVNKSTKVTRKTATEVEHFITNCPLNSNFKKKKKKKKKEFVSDHFSISFFLWLKNSSLYKKEPAFMCRKIVNDNSL